MITDWKKATSPDMHSEGAVVAAMIPHYRAALEVLSA